MQVRFEFKIYVHLYIHIPLGRKGYVILVNLWIELQHALEKLKFCFKLRSGSLAETKDILDRLQSEQYIKNFLISFYLFFFVLDSRFVATANCVRVFIYLKL